MESPTGSSYTDNIDYQDIQYYSIPKTKKLGILDDADPELLETFEKLSH